MSKQRYRLTMVYGMDAMDDVEARVIATRIMDGLGMPKSFYRTIGQTSPVAPTGGEAVVLVPTVKLQRVFDNKQPEAVTL